MEAGGPLANHTNIQRTVDAFRRPNEPSWGFWKGRGAMITAYDEDGCAMFMRADGPTGRVVMIVLGRVKPST